MTNFAAATLRVGEAMLRHLGNARITLQGDSDPVPGRLTREAVVADLGMEGGNLMGRDVQFSGPGALLSGVRRQQRLMLEELSADGTYTELGEWLVSNYAASPDLGVVTLQLERA